MDHFNTLNDDCLAEILKFLPIMDWCSLRETCTRLQVVSDDNFERHNKSFELKGEYITGSMYNDDLSMKDIKRLFRNFGRFITKLVINKNAFALYEDFTKLIPLLDRYCIALQNLKLVKIELNSATNLQCNRLFSNLERLVIDKCFEDDTTFASCLNQCGSLKELELIRMTNVEGNCLDNNFQNLESFAMNSCKDLDYNAIRKFFHQNKQLKSLKLIGCDFTPGVVLKDIMDYLPDLEELSLRFNSFFGQLILPTLRLDKLKKFEMDVGHGSVDIKSLLNGLLPNNNIETLHLATAVMNDELAQLLCEFKTVKILKFTATSKLDVNVYKKLASELPLLMEIHIVECNTTLDDLKEFVKHSSNLKKIVFNRCNTDDDPSLTHDIFLSIVEILKQKESKVTLNVHLNYDDLCEIENDFDYDGNSKVLTEQAHIIKLLHLDEENISTMYEYGSGFRRDRVNDGFFGFGESDDDYDDYDNMFDDGSDDSMDDFV